MSSTYSPCGIDCTECWVFIATRDNDLAFKQRLADDFYKEHGIKTDPRDINCEGCQGRDKLLGFCSVCQIRSCAAAKGFSTCAECADFPCDKGQFLWQKNRHALEILQGLKQQP